MPVNVAHLRELAGNPAATGYVPVHPDTLRSIADEFDRLHHAIEYATETLEGGGKVKDALAELRRSSAPSA